MGWEPEFENAREWGTWRGLIPEIRERARTFGASYFPNRVYLPFALLSLLTLWSRRIRFLGICVAAALLGNALVNWLFPHYLAPVLGAFMAIHLQFLRYVRAWNPRIFAAILALLIVLFGYRYYNHFTADPNDWAHARFSLIRQLASDGRNHLLLVRYAPDHIPHHEWVFNGPAIDEQKVILARAMSAGEDRELLTYYKGRIAWIVDADAQPPRLRPYPAETQKDFGSPP